MSSDWPSPTLHDVVVPAVGELPVISVLVQTPQEDLVRVAVLQVDEAAQPRQERGVAVGAVLIGQDGHLVTHLGRGRARVSYSIDLHYRYTV